MRISDWVQTCALPICDQDQCRVEVVEVPAGPCLVQTGGMRATTADTRDAACPAAHSQDSRPTPIVSPIATPSPRPAVRPLARLVTLAPCHCPRRAQPSHDCSEAQ